MKSVWKGALAGAIALGGLVAVSQEASALPVLNMNPVVAGTDATALPGIQHVWYRYGYGWRRPFVYGYRPYWRRPFVYGYRRPFYGYRRYW